MAIPEECLSAEPQNNNFNLDHNDDVEKIQNVLISEIEVEFAQCEHFPQPMHDQSMNIKTEPIGAHPLFGNNIYETDVCCLFVQSFDSKINC